MNKLTVESILENISWAPSGLVSIVWKWEVVDLYPPSSNVAYGSKFRIAFHRPDAYAPASAGVHRTGYGRWWLVDPDATESSVVKTAFAACKMIIEHELMEAFLYKNTRIFNPHHTVQDLMVAAVSHKEE